MDYLESMDLGFDLDSKLVDLRDWIGAGAKQSLIGDDRR